MSWYESKLAVAVAIQVAIVIVLLMYIVKALCKGAGKGSRKSGFLACTINGNDCVAADGHLLDGILQTYEVPYYNSTMTI
jgi:hypothetical protein